MNWFLTYKNIKKSFAEWHLFNVHRRTINQGSDTFSFQIEDGYPSFDCDEVVEIFCNNKRYFSGKITQIPCTYSTQEAYKTYIVSGTYNDLQHLVFQQAWQYLKSDGSGATTPVNRSLCILGQDETGKSITAKQCIESIIDYAKKHNVSIECGKMTDFDFYFPCETIKDCSCAEALQKILHWAPDTVVWMDYSTNLPTIHFARNNALTTTALDFSKLSEFSLIPRNDLKISAVVLKYEHTHSNENGSWKTTTIDTYPENATGEELNALVLTIELEGTHTHLQEQWIVAEPIQTDSVDWWKQHFPTLASIPSNKIQITNVKRTSTHPNELIEGAIAPWMHCQAAYETITAQLSYTSDNASVQNQPIALKLCTTNATTKTYRKFICLNEGVEPPKNLAKILYEATHCLQHEASAKLIQTEVGPSFMGQKINIIGGNPLWAKLQLPIQEENVHIDSGTTWLKLGAPKQLGPNDLVQLMHTNRTRHITEDINARFITRSSGHTKTYFPHKTPLLNSTHQQGNYSQLIIGNTNKKICLDISEIPQNTQLKPRSFDVFENGQLKKLWLLSSN